MHTRMLRPGLSLQRPERSLHTEPAGQSPANTACDAAAPGQAVAASAAERSARRLVPATGPRRQATGGCAAGAGQRGATALLTVTVLVLLAGISAAMTTRSLWLERLGSDNRAQALQARLAAESALARAVSQVQQAAQAGDLDLFWQQSQADDCPASHPAPGWECRRLDWPASPGSIQGAAAWHLQALALRHLTQSPHVVLLQARAWQGAAAVQLGQSLYQPALAPVPQSLPVALAASAAASGADGSSACEVPAWTAALGAQTERALRQLSQRQARAGLDEHSMPARTIYWVDSAQPWVHSLGQPTRPVLLVFSRQACALACPRLAAGTQVHGTVVFDAGCNADALPAGAAGQIDGEVIGLVLGPSGPAAASERIVPSSNARDALALRWPQGMDSTQVQWVAGSWWVEAAP